MDSITTIEKIFQAYQDIKNNNLKSRDWGDFFVKYPAKEGFGFLYVVLSSPTKKYRGKKKDLDKALNKSAKANKVVSPKDFDDVYEYLYQNFQNVVKGKDEILVGLENFLAGLRIELLPYHNMKYVFLNPNHSDMIAYQIKEKGQLIFYVNLIGMKEDGLILAHERQLEYIKESIRKGISPNKLTSLPPLRTGETEIDFSPHNKKEAENDPESALVAQFREKIKQKKLQGEIDEELAFETVIDFANKGRASIQVENKSKDIEKHNIPTKEGERENSKSEFASSEPLGSNPNENLKDEMDRTHLVFSDENDSRPSSSAPINAIDASPFANIPKPAPLSKESVISDDGDQTHSENLPTNGIPSYEKPPPIALPDDYGKNSNYNKEMDEIIELKKQIESGKDEKKLIQQELEDLTAQFSTQIKEKDQHIAELSKRVSKLSEENQNLSEELENAKLTTEERIARLRNQFEKIQIQIQPLIQENQELRKKLDRMDQTQKISEDINLINRNLTLQEKYEISLKEIENLKEKIRKTNKITQESKLGQEKNLISTEIMPSHEETKKKANASTLQNALLNSLHKNKEQIEFQNKILEQKRASENSEDEPEET